MCQCHDEMDLYRKWLEMPPDEPEPDDYGDPSMLIAVAMAVFSAGLIVVLVWLACWAKLGGTT